MHLLVLVVILGLQLHDLPASRGHVSKQASQPARHRPGCPELVPGVTCPLVRISPPPKGPKANNWSMKGRTPRCKQTSALTQSAFRGDGPSSGPQREAWPRGYGTATRVWSWAWPRGPTGTPLAWSRAQTCFDIEESICVCMYVCMLSSSPNSETTSAGKQIKNGRGFLEAGGTPELGGGHSW
jgi:hypothetical protein